MFCGSKKSWQRHPDGQYSVPAASVGVMVLPLMVFHQVQLMTCAMLARRYQQKQQRQQQQAAQAKAL
ncbi:Uncharacterised protein [Serratia rubidaea]|uniref:Uncharacterized protein n=1 Tax=Serratia rubidaea TaxID=61652 RepID=A0A447QGF6_SERRU|nr:Uncharacterised protein [Serratia rubidaea]